MFSSMYSRLPVTEILLEYFLFSPYTNVLEGTEKRENQNQIG